MKDAPFTLYVGNRNYSSWSFRGWLALRLTGAPFREERFHLGDPASREGISAVSPGGKVPALHHGDLVVWDSMAIAEYLAEIFPERRLWPEAQEARAVARSMAAEMHAGFGDLRANMPMNVRRSSPGKGRTPAVETDIARIRAAWSHALARYGVPSSEGPYLFGRFTLADAFYAPVVSRFRTYAVELDPVCRAYADAVWSHSDVRTWADEAAAEPELEPKYDL